MEKGKDLEITILGRKIAGINILWAFCILAFLAWLLYQIIVLLISKPSNVGEYGDMFGSLNALFAALAFVGLIFAILLQREELKLQRKN